MTAKIRSALYRIIPLIIATGLTCGLFCTAVCDESYDTLRRYGDYQNRMSVPSLPAKIDIFADTSGNVDVTRTLTERSESGRQLIISFDNTARADSRNRSVLYVNLCLFLFCVLRSTSFKHIFYIHLKDGNK